MPAEPPGSIRDETCHISQSIDHVTGILDNIAHHSHFSEDDKLHILVTRCIIHATSMRLHKINISLSSTNSAEYSECAVNHAIEIANIIATVANWAETTAVFCDPVLAVSSIITQGFKFIHRSSLRFSVSIVHILARFTDPAIRDLPSSLRRYLRRRT